GCGEFDASNATQELQSLVEPQSSSVAGGSFMTYLDGRTERITVYDGREVAPAQASSTMFLHASGKPLPFATAVLSGRATGVPGVLKMLDLAHREHGRLPWSTLFGDAERKARDGFIVSPRLARLIHGDEPENGAPEVLRYFSKRDGTLLNAGDRLINRPYAD